MNTIQRLWEGVKALFDEAQQERRIKEVDAWDGSASRFDSTDAYCAACLIDVNGAAGREEKAQSHCMLPVREPGDGADTYVKQAVYAVAGGRGLGAVKRPADVPEDAWNAAVKAAANKIISAYGQMEEVAPDSIYKLAGKEPPERAVSIGAIFEQINLQAQRMDGLEMPWVNDLYEDNGQLVAILSAGGKLYRAPVFMDGSEARLGTPTEIEVQFTPALRQLVSVARMADGRRRWFAIAETSVLNRVGEIDSTALFDSFVANATEHGYPELRFFHDSRLRMGEADWVARDGNVYLASGLLDEDNPLADAFADAVSVGRGQWGTSVGFLAVEPPVLERVADGVTVPVYTAGINREISVLPESRAASWFTNVDLEVKRMRKEVEDALRTLFGDETLAGQFIGAVDGTNRAIDEERLIAREDAGAEAVAEAATEAVAEDAEDKDEEPAEVVVDEALVEAIAERVAAKIPEPAAPPEPFNPIPLQEAIASVKAVAEGLAERLAALERSDEEKRREWLADQPARRQVNVTYRPRQEAPAETPATLQTVADATLAALPRR